MDLEEQDLTESTPEEMLDHIFDCHEVIKSLRRQVYMLITDMNKKEAEGTRTKREV
jgi:hypothetical protein